MLAKEFFQFPSMQMLLFHEMQPHNVMIGPSIIQRAVSPQLEHSPQAKPALRSDQMQQERVRLLSLDRRPRLALLRHHKMHELLIVPQELPLRLRLAQHLAQLFQQLKAPGHASSGREALAEKVPLLTERFPRRDVFWTDRRFLREPRKTGDRIFQK